MAAQRVIGFWLAFAGAAVLLLDLVMVGVWGADAVGEELRRYWLGFLGFPLGFGLAVAGFFAFIGARSARAQQGAAMRGPLLCLLFGVLLLVLPALLVPLFAYGWDATITVGVGGRRSTRTAGLPFMVLAWMCWVPGAVYGLLSLSALIRVRRARTESRTPRRA